MKNTDFKLTVNVIEVTPEERRKGYKKFLMAVARGAADKKRKLRSLDKITVNV